MRYLELDDTETVLLDRLELISPGRPLRNAIDYVIQGQTGGLIVVGSSQEILDSVEGGFDIKCEFLPARIYELSKMDGAVVVSGDLKHILYANAYIRTNASIPTKETGTRHQTAERLARQTGGMVIAISRRRGTVTLFAGQNQYVLPELPVLIAGANLTLLALDRYMALLKTALADLDRDEIARRVTLTEVVSLIQRVEMVRRAESELNRYRIELGNQAQVLQLRHPTVTAELSEGLLAVQDYHHESKTPEEAYKQIFHINSQRLSDGGMISAALGYPRDYTSYDGELPTREYRILSRVHRLPMFVVENLVEKFHDLHTLACASVDVLQQVDGIGEVRASGIQRELRALGFSCEA